MQSAMAGTVNAMKDLSLIDTPGQQKGNGKNDHRRPQFDDGMTDRQATGEMGGDGRGPGSSS
jgi:hypothetical protein